MKPYKELPGEVYIFGGQHKICLKPLKQDKKIKLGGILQGNFEIGAQDKNLSKAVENIDRFIEEERLPLSKNQLVNFFIAISEAIGNAIAHGEKRPERKIGINILYIPDDSLYVGVTDDLGPLDLDKLKFDVVDESGKVNLSDHGRGVFTMIMLSSVVVYLPSESRYKEILLQLELV